MIRLFYLYFALLNIYNSLDLRRWWRVHLTRWWKESSLKIWSKGWWRKHQQESGYFLIRQRFEQKTIEHMSNNQLLKYSLIGMKLWSMGGTLQTAHSTSTSSLVTHSLSRGGERTLCRFTRSLKFCTFLQTRGTVHRLCEGEEKLLKISSLTYVFRWTPLFS